MNGVVGMIDLLRQTGLNAEQREMSKTIRDSAYSLLSIINDILDFSKIEAGQLVLERISVSPLEVIESVGDIIWHLADQKGVDLVLDLATDGPARVYGDPTRLRQVVLNLVNNAIKFSSREDHRGRVRIALAFGTDGAGAGQFTIAVSDNGVGMSKEQVAELYRPFQQADSSTTRTFGGTGLGLSISKNLIDMMGGRIEVASTPGEASTFTVILPYEEAPVHDGQLREEVDLSNARFGILLPEDRAIADVVARSIVAKGGKVRRMDDLEHLTAMPFAHRHDMDEALILGTGVDHDAVMKALAKTETPDRLARLKSVRLASSPSDQKGMTESRCVTIGSHPLKPSELLQACAVALGRASPLVAFQGEKVVPLTDIEPPSIQQAEADGTLILVAEDHKTNQQVIRMQLNGLGYACEIVENGQEALMRLDEGGRYGLLLTDCHMPVMDGFDLSRRIREREKAEGDNIHLPIVAITANALVGEADRCYDAGMDGYLSKPVELVRLSRVLKKWLPQKTAVEPTPVSLDLEPVPREPAPAPEPEAEPEPMAAEPVVDETAAAAVQTNGAPFDFGRLADLLGNDEPEFLKSMVDYYWETAQGDIREIEAAATQHNAKALRDAAHAAKGGAESAAALNLGKVLLALQNEAESGDWKRIEPCLAQVRTAFTEVETWITRDGDD